MHTPEQAEDAFGFSSIRKTARDRIKQIQPVAPPEPPSDFSRLDEVAGHAGFVSREAPTESEMNVRRGRPRGPEAFQALNMRAPVSLAEAFKGWCDENRYSYPAGLAEIMRRAGILTKR